MPTDAHLYKIRDKRRFLIAAMRELSATARISFEGDLSATAVAHLAGASANETEILKRNTLWPKQDFVVLPLETDLVGAIIAAVPYLTEGRKTGSQPNANGSPQFFRGQYQEPWWTSCCLSSTTPA